MSEKKEKSNPKMGKRSKEHLFPRDTLKRSLNVSHAIWEQNGGNPFNILDLAPQVGYSPNSSGFRVLLASSFRYGLTEGSHITKIISLTNLGKSIVAPLEQTDVGSMLRQALLHNDLFAKVYKHFDGKPIPKKEVLRNTLVHDPSMGGFGIPREDVESFIDIFIQNIIDYNLEQDIRGTNYLRLDKLSTSNNIESEDKDMQDVEFEEEDEENKEQKPIIKEQKLSETETPKVFISHSKNKKILEQIKQMLQFGKFEYEIAIETETTAIPIPEKIFGLMRECTCAVINVSADESERKEDGSYGVNPNVLIEIGAAFLRYDKRVILLVDKKVKLPSNLQGLYQTYYEGNELSWDTAMKLQESLSKFRDNKTNAKIE
ncbi:hypothetical protein NZNM25_18680 [Nitrosopumilus zosterae]|uniref:CD-NTase-associated protein 12/Pycsar effector protein TIR domain-containing protein n=1 Tax=Nitrosopumilus zosterae TaxID=718286 RepID=A0A2S2KU42_9ARCH|nr:TIR domain-containing protein [Nitrosopumilus zosterae]BDQ31729.1 nucleotide-binding protein [Nitrosopumilus zosterae]GBH35077.1 hypothetical protein NZNM25_18680 [Nitrosopumilus zosterae]